MEGWYGAGRPGSNETGADCHPRYSIIIGMVAPHMLAFELLGIQEARRMMSEQPVLLRATLHKARAWTTAYAQAAVDVGADAICLVDSAASGDFLSKTEYEKWALPFHRKACAEIEKMGVPAILHICGDTTENLSLMAKVEAEGISVDHRVNISYARKVLGNGTAVIGNISPAILLRGSPTAVAAQTRDCIEAGVDLVSPGCGLGLQTPISNLRAMVDATRSSSIQHGKGC